MQISAVIPTYNHGAYVTTAIDSVLTQSLAVQELIVVDDGSTDDTFSKIAPYRDRVRYIRQANRGLSAARNAGIEASRGDWVAFLDADDAWHPRKIELQVAALQRSPSAALCYGSCIAHDELSGSELIHQATPPDRLWPALRYGNCVTGSGSAVLVRKDAVEEQGGFSEDLTACEDWDMWVRLARRHSFVAVSTPIVRIRFRQSSMSTGTDRMLINTERILATTLLADLRGLQRIFWSRRIRSSVLYSQSWTERDDYRRRRMVVESIRQWPSPFFRPYRYATLLRNLPKF